MKLTIERLKKLIREQMEEMSQPSDISVGKEIYLAPPEGAETINDMQHYEIYSEQQPNGGMKFYINYDSKGKVYLKPKGSDGEFPATYISGPSDGRTFTDLSGNISLGTKGFSAGKVKDLI